MALRLPDVLAMQERQGQRAAGVLSAIAAASASREARVLATQQKMFDSLVSIKAQNLKAINDRLDYLGTQNRLNQQLAFQKQKQKQLVASKVSDDARIEWVARDRAIADSIEGTKRSYQDAIASATTVEEAKRLRLERDQAIRSHEREKERAYQDYRRAKRDADEAMRFEDTSIPTAESGLEIRGSEPDQPAQTIAGMGPAPEPSFPETDVITGPSPGLLGGPEAEEIDLSAPAATRAAPVQSESADLGGEIDLAPEPEKPTIPLKELFQKRDDLKIMGGNTSDYDEKILAGLREELDPQISELVKVERQGIRMGLSPSGLTKTSQSFRESINKLDGYQEYQTFVESLETAIDGMRGAIERKEKEEADAVAEKALTEAKLREESAAKAFEQTIPREAESAVKILEKIANGEEDIKVTEKVFIEDLLINPQHEEWFKRQRQRFGMSATGLHRAVSGSAAVAAKLRDPLAGTTDRLKRRRERKKGILFKSHFRRGQPDNTPLKSSIKFFADEQPPAIPPEQILDEQDEEDVAASSPSPTAVTAQDLFGPPTTTRAAARAARAAARTGAKDIREGLGTPTPVPNKKRSKDLFQDPGSFADELRQEGVSPDIPKRPDPVKLLGNFLSQNLKPKLKSHFRRNQPDDTPLKSSIKFFADDVDPAATLRNATGAFRDFLNQPADPSDPDGDTILMRLLNLGFPDQKEKAGGFLRDQLPAGGDSEALGEFLNQPADPSDPDGDTILMRILNIGFPTQSERRAGGLFR